MACIGEIGKNFHVYGNDRRTWILIRDSGQKSMAFIIWLMYVASEATYQKCSNLPGGDHQTPYAQVVFVIL